MINGERNLNNKITNEIWIEWSRKGMLTPSMQKNLKLVRSYINKFCDELEENLDQKERDKLEKQLIKFDYRLIDDYTLKKLFRDLEDRYKYVVMEREKFISIIEEVAEVNCVGCTKDYKKCIIFKAFDDINLEKVDEESNCPYAVDLEKGKREEGKRRRREER
ncbi:DUF5651 domain-containing protein, partial [Clostridium botulinum]|uniref:DUF5651 domain-containing protein n=1 Tax=Clostridium botulinum TaxID=1491 RepID=UPI001C9ADD18